MASRIVARFGRGSGEERQGKGAPSGKDGEMQTWACTVAFLLYFAGIACVGIGAFFFSGFPSRTPPSEGSAIGDGITFFVGSGWILTGFLFVGVGTVLLVLQEILGELRRQGRPAEKKAPTGTAQVRM